MLMGTRVWSGFGLLVLSACANDTSLIGGIPLDNAAPVASVNAATDYAPLDTALFDGSASYDPDGAIASWTWEVLDRPDGSNSTMIPIDGGRRAQFFVDLAGDYTIRLTVRDEHGAPDSATATINAIPWQALHVQLSWDTNNTDIDLHLVDEDAGGSFCALPNDCFYGNTNPDWGSYGSYADDPRLDIDNVTGYGPENINLDAPEASGRYGVFVHYYRDNGGPSEARIRIYLDGVLKWEGTQILDTTNETWNVATIDWPTQQVTVNGNLFDSLCSSF